MQKEAIQRAFSEEKHRNIDLADQQRCQQNRISDLEREVIDLRAVNVRLHDSEVAANRELELLRERNGLMLSEAESMRK